MSHDYKKSVEKSIAKYFERIDKPSEQREKRKNKKPEADLRLQMLTELRKKGFLILYVESQAVFSVSAGRYLNSQALPGTSDLIGSDPLGHFVAIELKAPGRLRTLRENQRNFLESVIRTGGFAACVDSLDLFDWIYQTWRGFDSIPDGKKFLLEQIPTRPESAYNKDLFKME